MKAVRDFITVEDSGREHRSGRVLRVQAVWY